MYLLEGLLLHEIILMILGIILFLALVYLMIDFAKKDKPIKPLLKFFLLPVIMIGFSGFQKINFLGLTAELEQYVNEANELEANNLEVPESTLNEIAEITKELDDKYITSSETFINLSKANKLIGDSGKALDYAEKVPRDDPNRGKADELIQELVTPDVISRTNRLLEEAPADEETERKLEKRIEVFKKRSDLTTNNLEQIAVASAALKDTAEAVRYADSVLKINPRSKTARKIKSTLRR